MTLMQRLSSACSTAATTLCLLAVSAPAATYHVDQADGDDSRDGLSPATAWRTLAPVNAATFAPNGVNGVRPFDVREAWRQSGPARVCCSEHRTA